MYEVFKDFTILCVDDDKIVLKILNNSFKNIFKEVLTATNGLEGYEVFKSKQPDMIITDMTMPILDGIEMIKKIRKVDTNIPIFVSSAIEDSKTLLQSIDLGVSGYVVKPLNIKTLINKLEQSAKSLSYELLKKRHQEELQELNNSLEEKVKIQTKELEELKSNKGGVNEETLKEYAEKAIKEGLTDDDYKSLEKLGYDKDTIDVFVEGLKAKQSKSAEELLQGVTTMEEYQEAVKWAADNWDKEQIEEFNTIIAEGNPTAIRLVVRGLVKEAKGMLGQNEQPNLHNNTNRVKPQGIQGYETKADMIKDMSDPRYGKDIAYTRKVEQRVMKSDTTKWYL